jgi:hypothetical protein
MARGGYRLNVTLDEEHAERLRRLAERMHVEEGALARSLLSSPLEEADPDARSVAALLEGIDESFERAQAGLEDVRASRTRRLDEVLPGSRWR